MTDITLENIKCHIETVFSGGPIVFWGTPDRGDNSVSAVVSYLKEANAACTLFVFEAEDWNCDFSPWEMHTDDFDFAGCGGNTLKWLTDTAIPYVRENISNTAPLIIAGYSLAGLFALWSFYETGIFKGIACCSASLWFEGWDEFVKGKTAPSGSIVYLSLGGKESSSHNTLMATIGEKYKLQEKRCKADKNIAKTIFEMNPGGHFANPPKRVAKGIIQILKDLQ